MSPANSTPDTSNRESVGDYPHPPRLEADPRHIVVTVGGTIIADTTRSWRMLETGLAPVFYVPPEDVRVELLQAISHTTHCPFKGEARYYDIVVDDVVASAAAWCYPEPEPDYRQIRHAIAFYPDRVELATVDDEPATPQPGGFYGGWVTSEIDGPFRDTPDTDDSSDDQDAPQ